MLNVHAAFVLALFSVASPISAQEIVTHANGRKAFDSYMSLTIGGTWTRSDDPDRKHSYKWVFESKFAQLTGEGGPLPFIAMIGVEPKSDECTWWFYNEDGSTTMYTLEQVGEDSWTFKGGGKGTDGKDTSYECTTTKIDRDTIKEEIKTFIVNGEKFPTGTFTWKRTR